MKTIKLARRTSPKIKSQKANFDISRYEMNCKRCLPFLKVVGVCLFIFVGLVGVSAQNIGINSTGATPHISAGLDVDYPNKGLLIPRVSLTSTTDVATIPTPATSLLVYNTNAGMTGGSIGYWYWNGAVWSKFITLGTSSGGDWSLFGNAGTNPTTNFIGTTDNNHWAIRTNNTERIRILSNGNIGVRMTNPSAEFEISTLAGGGRTVGMGSAGLEWGAGMLKAGVFKSSIYYSEALPISGLSIKTYTADPIYLQTNNITRLFITGAGDVAIGSNLFTPAGRLDVQGAGSTSATFAFGARNSFNNYILAVRDDGRVGINTIAPTQALHVVGNVCFTGTAAACSDVRYKKDITQLTNALDNVMQLKGVHYYWRTEEFPDQRFNTNLQLGFIAQDIEKLYPEVVQTDDKGYKSVDYSRLTPILVEAIKELKKTIDELELAYSSKDADLKRLKSEVNQIKEVLNLKASK